VRDTRERLVIVGFGIAAHRFVERLRGLDALDRYDLTVFGEEPMPAYNRVRLTEWLDHGDLERLVLPSRQWSAAHGVRVVTDRRVVSIERERGGGEPADASKGPTARACSSTAPFKISNGSAAGRWKRSGRSSWVAAYWGSRWPRVFVGWVSM